MDKEIKEESREELEYIKNFSNIKVSKICRKLNIDQGNLGNGKCGKEKEKKVKKAIESEIAKLYLGEDNE